MNYYINLIIFKSNWYILYMKILHVRDEFSKRALQKYILA